MSDALPLPARPDLAQYRKIAKELQRACRSGEADAVREWAARLAETVGRLRGEDLAGEAHRLEYRWREFRKKNDECTLAGAQFFLARAHGFPSWPKFAGHLEALAQARPEVALFEAAVNAIVGGDAVALAALLKEDPELVRRRSAREHRSTLLHYVSANGVEDFRQKTPANIVEMVKMLLDAGADVNAESDAYGGRSTALGLTATSCHPEAAGVQIQLMELLLAHGARIDEDGVNACLHNGRGRAAEFLASRGARLDLEGAAGVGRLDVVRSLLNDDGSLKPAATRKQLLDGFGWACAFGRNSVVAFLLERSLAVDVRLAGGETGLHWAAYEGRADTVELLLAKGAPVDAVDERYEGTPLGWALYGWGYAEKEGDFHEVVRWLVRAGAALKAEWFEADDDRNRAAARVRADSRMAAALRGEAS